MERRISLRAAVNACATDDDVMRLAKALWASVLDEEGQPRLDVVDRLAKFLPSLPGSEAIERARSVVRGNYEEAAEHALAVLIAHAEMDSDAEAARHVVEAVAKWTAAKKAAAESGAGTGTTVINVVPASTSTTSVSVARTTDEVTE